jgi:hypothetical protein
VDHKASIEHEATRRLVMCQCPAREEVRAFAEARGGEQTSSGWLDTIQKWQYKIIWLMPSDNELWYVEDNIQELAIKRQPTPRSRSESPWDVLVMTPKLQMRRTEWKLRFQHQDVPGLTTALVLPPQSLTLVLIESTAHRTVRARELVFGGKPRRTPPVAGGLREVLARGETVHVLTDAGIHRLDLETFSWTESAPLPPGSPPPHPSKALEGPPLSGG